MADDDDTTSSPWGRSRRTPGRPTPAPGSTPPPESGADAGAASFGTPAPPAAGSTPPPTAPAGTWTPTPGPFGPGGYGGTPPPGYPPGGYPPGGPVPARTGGGSAVALVIGLLVVVAVGGAAVALVLVLGNDDDPVADRDPTTTVAPATTAAPGSSELPGSSEAPGSTDAPGTTELPTSSSPLGPSAPPDGFPEPAGAATSVTGGIEVPGMTPQQVADFYEAELPGAGYTVDRVDEAAGSFVVTVSGPAQGTLTIVAFDPLPTTVLWTGS